MSSNQIISKLVVVLLSTRKLRAEILVVFEEFEIRFYEILPPAPLSSSIEAKIKPSG